MKEKNTRVCPVENAGVLDNIFRKWINNPNKILKDYIKEGMTVLDVGCGPGFFTVELAKMVGKTGRVIAADLQEGMLEKLENKIKGKEIEKRIELYQCDEDKIGISEKVDFILAFYMVHEIPNQMNFFKEMDSILKPNGRMFVVEPKFHVSKCTFENTINIAKEAGFKIFKGKKVFFSKTIILKH